MYQRNSFVVICMVLIFLVACCWSTCPFDRELEPLCSCRDSSMGGILTCEDVFNPTALVEPMESCRGHLMFGLILMNSSLLYLPQDLFDGTNFERIMLSNTELMSLSNGKLAFVGLENTLREIRASDTSYATQWRFSKLRRLKLLELIDIHYIFMESIDEDLPHLPELTALGVTHGGINYISDFAFAECPNLKLLDLRYNEITELKRTMFPYPAEHLDLINLQYNKLGVLPDDIFDQMPELMEINLADNLFMTLDEKVFSSIMRTLGTLDMKNNPFRCDCRLSWLVAHRLPTWFHGMCVKPESLKGASLRNLMSRDLYC